MNKWYDTDMNLQKIQMVLADQKAELAKMLARPTCARREESMINLHSKLAQVVTGVRRSGKSTMCLNVLKSSGRNFGYINFDDERLATLTGEDLDTALSAAYKIYGDFDTLFLDEPQNMDEWALFVNRLLRSGMHLVVTGSNSNLLSGELMTHMSGRYSEIKLMPYSFGEYCAFKGVDPTDLSVRARAMRSTAFDEYLKNGAFPEVAEGENPKTYIRTLIENIRTKDIERRYKIRYRSALRKLIDHVLDSVPMVLDTDELAKMFSFNSKQTAANYVEYMERSFLVNRLGKYSTKPKLRVFGEKLYPADVSFMDSRENAMQGENFDWRMETIVRLELLRRARTAGHDMYYFKDARHECDFVVCKDRKALAAYQVSYDMSSPKTRKREIKGAVAAAKALHLARAVIVTYGEVDEIKHPSGIVIEVVAASDWLAV
jgi:uncharacterized protein